MASAEWTRVRELFDEAAELQPAAQRAYLDQHCGEDAELRRQVEELLAADRDQGTGTVAIEKDIPAGLVGEQPHLQGSLVGQRIGSYQIQRVLGTGGMSTVFEAQQEHPRRIVALKTMRLGLLSDNAKRRFEYESEVLGRLRHAAIAQVYEAGTWQEPMTGQEVPFFAMEFVEDAMPLTHYVREHGLALGETLELFLRVCDAVQHGHQLGFIHRDLKPANVLVDGHGQPKVIDFGIARATETDDNRATLLTEAGQVLGTLQYMAPEQLDAQPERIDTRADVYALGVILYEMLAGGPPHDPTDVPLPEFARRVRDQEAPLPSTSADGFVLSGLARDLDWITRKAIAAEKDERYAAVSDLAQDIRRFLNNEPVTVGPPSTTYYIRKFVRRNKVLVGGMAAVFVALVLGVVGTTWQMLRAEDAAEDARIQTGKAKAAAAEANRQTVKAQRSAADALREARRARRINDFLNEILKFGSPTEGRYRSRPDITIREALVMAEKRLDQLDEDPDVEADVRMRLADAFYSTGRSDKARTNYQKARDLRTKVYGEDSAEVAKAIQGLALCEPDKKKALEQHRGTLAVFLKVHGEGHQDVALSYINIGNVLSDLGQVEEGIAEIKKGIAACRRSSDNLERFVAMALRSWAIKLARQGKKDEAIARHREALASFTKADKDWHPFAALGREDLAMLLRQKRQFAEAERLLREALTRLLDSYGEGTPSPVRVRWHLALSLKEQAKFADAEKELRVVESFAEKINPGYFPADVRLTLMEVLRQQEKHADAFAFGRKAYPVFIKHKGNSGLTWSYSTSYGRVLRDNGEFAAAADLFRRIAKAKREAKHHPGYVLMARNDLAVVLERQGKLDQAKPLFEEIQEEATKHVPKSHWMHGIFKRSYAVCLIRLGSFEEAEELLVQARRNLESRLGKGAVPVRRVYEAQARLYDAWGRQEDKQNAEARIATWRKRKQAKQAKQAKHAKEAKQAKK